jgi:hypothetical protein
LPAEARSLHGKDRSLSVIHLHGVVWAKILNTVANLTTVSGLIRHMGKLILANYCDEIFKNYKTTAKKASPQHMLVLL